MVTLFIFIGVMLIFLGLMLVFWGVDDDEIGLILGGAGVLALGAIILPFAISEVPNCDTEKITPITLTVKGTSYEVTEAKICDNGVIKIKGSTPEKEKPPVKVKVS